MAIPSKQIGWGTEANLLYEILKRIDKLTSLFAGSSVGQLKYQLFVATEGQTTFVVNAFDPTDAYLAFIDYNAQSHTVVSRNDHTFTTPALSEGQVLLIVN